MSMRNEISMRKEDPDEKLDPPALGSFLRVSKGLSSS